MCFTVLLHAFISSLYTNLVYSQYPIVGGEGWLRFLDLWSGQKPCWHERLTRWRRWSAYDIIEAMMEGLENELWCKWSDRRVGEWGSAHSNIALPTSQALHLHHLAIHRSLLGLIFKHCGEFWWSLEGPVSQLHSPHLHVGVPGICSNAKDRVRCRKQQDLFIPSKTATLVLEYAVVDLPLDRTATLVPAFIVKDLPVGRILWWWWSYCTSFIRWVS